MCFCTDSWMTTGDTRLPFDIVLRPSSGPVLGWKRAGLILVDPLHVTGIEIGSTERQGSSKQARPIRTECRASTACGCQPRLGRRASTLPLRPSVRRPWGADCARGRCRGPRRVLQSRRDRGRREGRRLCPTSRGHSVKAGRRSWLRFMNGRALGDLQLTVDALLEVIGSTPTPPEVPIGSHLGDEAQRL